MATVVVKLEPLDDHNPSESPVNYSADYNIINIKNEVLDSLQSPDGGNVQKLEVKEEQNQDSKQEAELVLLSESRVADNCMEEMQQLSGTKRPRLSINEESLLRTSFSRNESGSRGVLERPRRLSRAQDSNMEHSAPRRLDETLLPPPTEVPTLTSRSRESNCDNGTQVSRDSLKMFFDAMYHDTKALPLHLQIRTKRILFQAVADAQDISGMSRPPLHNVNDHNHSSSTSRRVSSSGQMTDFNNPCC